MRRLISYIVLSILITAGAAWLISLPGTVSIEMMGYHLEPGLGASIFGLILLILISIAIWAIIRRVIETPRRLAKRAQQKRRDIGVDALSDGFVALQAGDANTARRLAKEAQNKLPNNAAAQLLEAKSDLALGDMVSAREHYRALISNPKTSLAALSGLYEQAQTQGRTTAALTFARKAAAIDAKLTWANDAVFADLAQTRSWAEALTMLSSQSAPKRGEKTALKHKKAVLHTAIALDAEERDPDAALAASTAALKLDANFVPAALISARIYINRNEKRKASSLLRRVWRSTAHPDIATLFTNIQPGASAVERLKTLRQIIETPQDNDAACVLARAAIDAYEWSVARNALANFSSATPTQKTCMLMAEIEEGQSGDQGKAREWLNRAVQAPRDPAWVADGVVSPEWEPISPITQRLDAFEWKVPTTQLAKPKPASTPQETTKIISTDQQKLPTKELPAENPVALSTPGPA